MPEIADLPHYTASLNVLTTIFLGLGYAFIRLHRRRAHRSMMLAAVASSVAFIAVYLTYHLNSGFTPFSGNGPVRILYFAVLIIHVAGSAILVFLVPVVLIRALRERFKVHKRLASKVWPLWIFASISGIAIYVMNVRLYPPLATVFNG